MKDEVIFFRSLAVMFNAGLSLHECLRLLANSCDTPETAAVYQALGERVERGLSFSDALSCQPLQFSRYQVSLVRVGERSGALARVLSLLADQLEKTWALRKKLSSSLTYPGVLIICCLTMLVLAPSFLLDGHLRMLTSSGVALPWSTRLLLFWTEVLSPLHMLLGAAILVPLTWKVWQHAHIRNEVQAAASRLPGLGRILKLSSSARFARSLAVSMRAGVNLLEGMSLAAAACEDKQLEDAVALAGRSVENGSTLGEGLLDTGYFLIGFPELIQSGEVIGRADALLELGADLYEQEIDLALDTLSTLLEPLLLLLIGILTAFMLTAVLQPTLGILQAL